MERKLRNSRKVISVSLLFKSKVGPEEVQDVLDAYVSCTGDMFNIIDHVPCAELDDIERFQVIIQNGIDEGKVEEFPKFRKVSKAQLARKRKRAEKEAIQAEEAKKEMQQETQDLDALKSLIQNRQKDRLSNMINSLEEKYGNEKKNDKKIADKGIFFLK